MPDKRMSAASETFPLKEESGPSYCEDKDSVTSFEESSVLNIANSLNCDNSLKSKRLFNGENGNLRNSNPSVLISTLTLTEDHPLMACSSPDSPSSGKFPSFVINSHKCKNNFSDVNIEFSDESFNRNNISGEVCSLYGEGFSPHNGPQRNTSKNNLYISDNIVSPDSNKALDGDELRNYVGLVDGKMHVKSKMTGDLIDSGNKYNAHTLSDTSNNQLHCSTTVHSSKTSKIVGTESIQRNQTGNNIPQSSYCNFKKEDDVSDMQEESCHFAMRKNSWSDSESSEDSLCNCSIISEEHEDTSHHHKTENDEEKDNAPEKIPEYSLKDERTDSRKWLKIILPSGERKSVDMKVIEPYKRVLSHGGYASSGRRDAIVVFSACFLPDSCRVDYNYVMDNLFLYVLTTMEQLVTDEYILIYLHGSASKRSMPTFHWLKKCYQLIDRRLRKSLKHLYLVHPTFWLKSVVFMTRPFISSKFFNKLTYVHSLEELHQYVPVENAAIPERVRRFDSLRS